ncbi:hypothetical protein GCM10010967_36970 [Dyadobacter beijingensis]|uniref:Uncharacterized protein n=1 Tax=Dyadobacter beijingensis TaxID=365489 RepID=A0ABQ2I3N3_9BACT|nr:hypothetical protein [Dyadobacter beijingensis]GGM99599.1 hypothetical protein GCM10010967_36970 [Dyadobacter beijingensis]
MFDTYSAYIVNNPISSIAVFITVLPLTLTIARRAFLDKSLRLLFCYLAVKLIIDLAMLHYASNRTNNIILYNLSIPLFYALLGGMFYFKFAEKPRRQFLIISIIGLFFFCAWDIVNSNEDLQNMREHRVVLYSKMVEGVLMILVILLYFYEIIKSLQIPNLLTFPFFWVCSGLLLYYSSLIFIAPVIHYAYTWNNTMDLGITEFIPSIFEIICALFFSVGIYHYSPKDYAKQ